MDIDGRWPVVGFYSDPGNSLICNHINVIKLENIFKEQKTFIIRKLGFRNSHFCKISKILHTVLEEFTLSNLLYGIN